jgi:hypothetical protein
MLTPEQEKWVQALESGEYTQGKNFLKKRKRHTQTFEYCCLGVACEVFGKNILTETDTRADGVIKFSDTPHDEGWSGSMPPAIMKILKLNTRIGENHNFSSLAEQNDRGDSFAKIAAFIRSEPVGLFKT